MLAGGPDAHPGARSAQGLITSATTPMNGHARAPGTPQAGYGFVNAINAINAVDLLARRLDQPGQRVDRHRDAQRHHGDLQQAGQLLDGFRRRPDLHRPMPPGVTVNVGTPIAVDNPTDPTIIQFPFSFTKPAGTLANGTYTFSIQSPASNPVVSEDGKDLVPSGPITFTLADVTSPSSPTRRSAAGPSRSRSARRIDPATVTLANIFVLRQGSATTWPPDRGDSRQLHQSQ